MNHNVYSVKQVNTHIETLINNDFPLNSIYVKGEIAEYTNKGHIYLTLKDESGQLKCVYFRGSQKKLDFELKKGIEIIAHGRIGVYKNTGTYQLYIDDVQEVGLGNIYKEFLKLKKELEESGMFDEMYKKPIPKYIKTLGIVTSSEAAALKDILKIVKKKNPYIKTVLSPCLVQGDMAPDSIALAISKIDKLNLDLIIVGRGGGSYEDLICFNDVKVANAIFDAKTPIISAVGHERDFTISDYVADLRAATPTEAAEIACFSYDDYVSTLDDYQIRLDRKIRSLIDITSEKCSSYNIKTKSIISRYINLVNSTYYNYKSEFTKYHPYKQFVELQNKYKDKINRINDLIENKFYDNKNQYLSYADLLNNKIIDKYNKTNNSYLMYIQRLDDISPTKRMMAGYSIVSDKNNKIVKSVDSINKGDKLNVNFSDGNANCIVDKINNIN